MCGVSKLKKSIHRNLLKKFRKISDLFTRQLISRRLCCRRLTVMSSVTRYYFLKNAIFGIKKPNTDPKSHSIGNLVSGNTSFPGSGFSGWLGLL